MITQPKSSCTPTFEALADARRRRILGILRTHDGAVPLSNVAARLAAREGDRSLVAVTDADRRRVELSLYHRHLPELAAAGLVEWDDEAGEATLADHKALADDGIDDATRLPVDDDLDPVFEALADGRRRTLLSVLGRLYHPIAARKLARRLVAEERDLSRRAVPEDATDRALTSLQHVHLPKLADVGLVTWDSDLGRVTYRGHPALRTRWLEGSFESVLEGVAADSADAASPRSVSGRPDIVTYGQSLCERADDELFLLFTATGLLEEGCFARISDAVDRGVDVYVGSGDPEVRELVHERVPNATVWEPERDWLDLPTDGDRLGRLVLADREAVLVGSLGAPGADDVPVERAIAGEGTSDALVTVVREAIGPRIDRFAERGDASEDPVSRAGR